MYVFVYKDGIENTGIYEYLQTPRQGAVVPNDQKVLELNSADWSLGSLLIAQIWT